MAEPLYKYLGKRSAKVGKVFTQWTVYEEKYPQWKRDVELASNDYEVGLEIEIERIHSHHNPTNYGVWQVKNDGSLRNSGYEYVSYPINGWRIPYAIAQFFGTVDKDYSFSPRTSIHVHLNAMDMTPEQVASFTLTYLVFEPLLYRFVGYDRDKNNFCVPLMDAFADITHYFTQPVFQFPNLGGFRYLGLNLDACRKFGTIEFRQMAGTDNQDKLLAWINLIFCLKTYATTHEFQAIVATIEQLNTNSAYFQFFRDVFGRFGNVLDTSNLQRDMEWPVSRIKHLALANPFFQEIRQTIHPNDVWVAFLTKRKVAEPDLFYFLNEVQRAQQARRRPRNWEADMDAVRQRVAQQGAALERELALRQAVPEQPVNININVDDILEEIEEGDNP